MLYALEHAMNACWEFLKVLKPGQVLLVTNECPRVCAEDKELQFQNPH